MIKWKELDKLETADDIYNFLKEKGIKGERGEEFSCPLARATGWHVYANDRCPGWCSWTSSIFGRSLTEAEQHFVFLFDEGEYPELDEFPDPDKVECVESDGYPKE